MTKHFYEVAKLARDGQDDAQMGVGMAVLTAGTRQLASATYESP